MLLRRKLLSRGSRRLGIAVSCALGAALLVSGATPTSEPVSASAQEEGNHSELVRDVVFAIHGGAGTIRREDLSPELEERYRNALTRALRRGLSRHTARRRQHRCGRGRDYLDGGLALVQRGKRCGVHHR